MLKAVWFSDPHFIHEGEVLGHNPRVRLEAAIEHINRYHSDAEICVISGDMVNRGTQADYSALRDQLSGLAIPFLPMVGNHDNREMLQQFLPVPETCLKDFIQYAVPTREGLIVCLDTQKLGEDSGEFCETRSDWLRKTLEDAANSSIYLFMHHPPMPLGLPMQDTENMKDGDAFLNLISAYESVKYLFIGHVHRPITGTIRGLPFSTMRSILYQAPAPWPEWNWDTFMPSEEAPNIGILTIAGASVNLQYEQFCRFENGAHAR